MSHSSISFDQAIVKANQLHNHLQIEIESIPLHLGQGRYLQENVLWDRDHPPFDRAAMDGFALSSMPDIGDQFTIIGSAKAGNPFVGEILAGQAVDIATGAVVPKGTKTLIQWEKTTSNKEKVTIIEAIKEKANIHFQGHDALKGDMVVPAQTLLTPAVMSALVTVGKEIVNVKQQISIGIIATGSELVALEQQPNDAQIRCSNLWLVQQMIKSSPLYFNSSAVTVKDDPLLLQKAIEEAEKNSDIIICIGGVGTSDKDHVPSALEKLGYTIEVHGVNQKPGHPLLMGYKQDKLVLGLPGNPISSMAGMTVYFPILSGFENWKMVGWSGDSYQVKGKRTMLVPVAWDNGRLEKIVFNGSGDMAAMSAISGFACINAGTKVEPGDEVRYYPGILV